MSLSSVSLGLTCGPLRAQRGSSRGVDAVDIMWAMVIRSAGT